MQINAFTTAATIALVSTVIAAPAPLQQRAAACFVVGQTPLVAEVQDSVDSIQNAVTCNAAKTTIDNVPDVTSGGISFSSIDFSKSSLSPLEFALTTFATSSPLADNDIATFQNQLNTYLATEAGIRSVDGNLAIKDPKFFLSFQIARIKTAQGEDITDPAQTVEHTLEKVIKNAGGESQATKDKVTALSKILS